MLQLPHLGSLAEADDFAVPFRRIDIPGNTSTPSFGSALRDAYFLAPDRFQAAELFQMHRLHVDHQRHGGLRQFTQPRDFA